MDQPSGIPSPHKNTLMAVLAYLGILVVIPLIVAKGDPFVKFHIKQGLVLVIIELAMWALAMTMLGWQLMPLVQIVNLGVLILAVIGIVNAVQGKEKELPLVGSFARNFNF
ncbi:hypothetical protein A2763_03170 [Candidatus Kaiserbacteria bacterium RIFCSPHIGHO2_01_FULL_54_36]|uniref:Import component protein n=1 Tax=Candidatus Kaiserbacteria bacterium RIFCSPHIGHO2_01_FULL_54_36 TaxID=1798482 RepID=A0A1F6CK74_9BACT|nr:MAG: hypothetical protein A2763_03170 [Candidatus Kaiserbacteria bacterium RIFCSPHIGHO2_01_FULL_54_36]OGG75400.1 MAG: hypothetical protein A3A41_02425 [Candidatus Kaiserbacteria bacterium RIFCSPLOWO2_01_FULL_54_22]